MSISRKRHTSTRYAAWFSFALNLADLVEIAWIMPSLLKRLRSLPSERPGLVILLCIAWMLVAAFVANLVEETPFDEKRSRYELRDLEAVGPSLLSWKEDRAYLNKEVEPFSGWEKQVVTLEDFAEEIEVSLFIPYRNGQREGHGEGYYSDQRHFSDTFYGSEGHSETTFYRSGQIRSRSSDHRLLEGTSWYYYDSPSPNGQKKFRGVWEGGVLVSETWWNSEGVETSSDKTLIPAR